MPGVVGAVGSRLWVLFIGAGPERRLDGTQELRVRARERWQARRFSRPGDGPNRAGPARVWQ